MIAPNLISDSIHPLHLDDSGEQALMAMQEYNVSQMPVVDGAKYAGLVTMDEIIGLKHLSHTLQGLQLPLRKPSVLNTSHIFDVMKAAVDFNVRVVPVIDEEQKYLGLISAESCLRAFATLNSVNQQGAIIELEIPLSEYSVSQMARVVEDNDAHILCFYTNINPATSIVEVTLKLNTLEVNGIVASFERYEFQVKAIYNDANYTQELRSRYDALMRYLNV